MTENLFYPGLSEEGQKECIALIEAFKKKMEKIAAETISNLYTDISPHIESDHWLNYRSQIINAFCDYGNNMTYREYDFKQLREKIFEEHKEAILRDLGNDLVEENQKLKKRIEDLLEEREELLQERLVRAFRG